MVKANNMSFINTKKWLVGIPNEKNQKDSAIFRVRTRFIQDNNFERWIGIVFLLADIFHLFFTVFFFHKKARSGWFGRIFSDGQACEMLNFVAYDRNTAFIRGIQFQDSPFQNGWRIQLFTKGQGNRGFSATRRAVLWSSKKEDTRCENTACWKVLTEIQRNPCKASYQQEMRELPRLYCTFESSHNIFLMGHFVQRLWPIELNPRDAFVRCCGCHGVCNVEFIYRRLL